MPSSCSRRGLPSSTAPSATTTPLSVFERNPDRVGVAGSLVELLADSPTAVGRDLHGIYHVGLVCGGTAQGAGERGIAQKRGVAFRDAAEVSQWEALGIAFGNVGDKVAEFLR